MTNAYSGSLAWTNSFTRVTKHYPGRIVFLGVNLLIALILMEANMFSFLNTILGFYANCGMAWVVVVASDIVFNKHLLKLSPMKPEFRRGMLYAINPVGFGSMLIAAGLSVIAFFGGLGEAIRPYSPLVAIVLGLVLPPIFAIATKGKYYLRRTDDGIDLPMYDEHGNPSGEHLKCHVCHHDYERPDMMKCETHDAHVLALPEHRQGCRSRAAGADLAPGSHKGAADVGRKAPIGPTNVARTQSICVLGGLSDGCLAHQIGCVAHQIKAENGFFRHP